MAFLGMKSPNCLLYLYKSPYLNSLYQGTIKGRNSTELSQITNSFHSGIRAACQESALSEQNCDAGIVSGSSVTNEIKFYRDSRNKFNQICFSDSRQQYGPPLAILLPWKDFEENLLKKFIEFYGDKGFDVLTVNMTKEQMLYPCVSGNAMNVVTELLDYLNDTHKHRPYIFHGFSVGIYTFGEILAQFAEHYDTYRTITNNVKGCLWDSPVDILTVKQHIGRHFYPKNWLKRYMLNKAVRKHFKKHYYDSVAYWLRARESFCNPIIKVPHVFLMSYTDLLSNPCSVQCVQKSLECNGVPIFQKTWWDSQHGRHFEKYCYEYMYGMILFLNLANLFPDESGKYRSSSSTACLANLRLSKTARDNFC